MAQVQSYTVQIDINSKGARVIVKNFEDVGRSARAAATSTSILTRAMAGLTAVFGTRQLIQFSDSLVNLRNRLSLITTNTSVVNGITRELLAIAKETRSEFDSTAQVYSRLALSARNLGLSQDQLLEITSNLNKAVLLSGTNTREAANGLIQLSQAIASNRLGGDELRSVLEQLPLVADLIGKQLVKMGIATSGTRGEVRQLGFEGKITSDVITKALLAATKDLEDQFKNTTPTISQAAEVIKTSVIGMVADFNSATGAGETLADLLLVLADNMETLAKVMIFVGTVASIRMVGGLTGIATAVKSIGAFLLGWPGLIALAVVAVIQLADAFDLVGERADVFNVDANDAITSFYRNAQKLTDEQKKEGDAFIDQIETIQRLLTEESNISILGRLFGYGMSDAEIAAKQRELQKLTRSLRDIALPPAAKTDPTLEQKKQAELIERIRRELNNEYEALKLTNRERKVATDLAKIEERLRAKKLEGQQLKDLLAEYKAMLERNQAQEEYANILADLREPAIDFKYQSEAISRIIAEYPELAGSATKALKQFYIESLQGATDAASGIERARAKLDLQLFDKAAAAEQAYTDIQKPLVDYTVRVEALNAVLAQNPELQAEVNRELVKTKIAFLDTQRSIGAGLERGFLKIGEDILDLASVTEDALTNAFNNAENALLDFFTTGKLSMTDFVNSLQRDLARLALRGLVVGTIGSALGLGGGGQGAAGLASFFTGLFSGGKSPGSEPAVNPGDPTNFATGGSFMVGGQGGIDSQLVAFRASPNERVTIETPEQQKRSRSGQGRPISVNMTVVTPDAQSFTRSQGQIAARQQALLSRYGERNN